MSRHFQQPRLVLVELDSAGRPAWLRWRGRRERARVCNAWRVEAAWWQDEVAADRAYYTLLTASGAALVVYQDEAEQRWYVEQVLD